MFEYAKQDLEEKIQIYSQKWNEKKKEEDQYEKEINKVKNCLEIKNSKNQSMALAAGSFVVSGISMVCNVTHFVNKVLLTNSSFLNKSCYMISGVGVLCLMKGTVDFIYSRHVLNKKYPNYANLDRVQLFNEIDQLSSLQYDSYCEANRYGKELRVFEKEMGMISHFEDVRKEISLMESDIYYLAKDYGDYQDLLLKKKIFLEQFEDFINEPIDPSNVHFDTVNYNSIQYLKK